MSNPYGIISNAIATVLSDQRNQSDIFMFNTYRVASSNNWNNDTVTKLVDTISIMMDMFSAMPDAYPSDVVTQEDRMYYAVELACENTGAILLAKAPDVVRQLDYNTQTRLNTILNRVNLICQDIDRHVSARQHSNRAASRYRNVQPAQVTQSAGHVGTRGSRYTTTQPTIIKEPVTVVEPSSEIPQVKRRSVNMDYSFHRHATELNPNARRTAPAPDFMGELANVKIKSAAEGSPVDLSKAFAITPLATPTATSLAHAKTLAMLDIAASGADYNDRQLLEYNFNLLNTLKVFMDAQQMQLFAVSVPSLSVLSRAETLEEVVDAIKGLLESGNSVAESIGRRLNAVATKHANDLVTFKLALTITIDDFATDALDLRDAVKDACDETGDPTIFDSEWGYCVRSLLSCLRCVYIAPEDESVIKTVDATFAASVAHRSVFWLEPTYVSYWPVAFFNLEIDPSYSHCGQAYLKHATHPELYKSFADLLERARAANEYGYCRIFVVTDDDVHIEILYTEVVDNDGIPMVLLRQA